MLSPEQSDELRLYLNMRSSVTDLTSLVRGSNDFLYRVKAEEEWNNISVF